MTRNYSGERDMVANKESIPLLEEYGFVRTSTKSPMPHKQWKEDPDCQPFMKYSVACNEEEVILFLIKNNIPFKASCHYDHNYVLFKKDGGFFLKAFNFGLRIDTYGFDDENDWEEVCGIPKVEKKSVYWFLKQHGIETEDDDSEDTEDED